MKINRETLLTRAHFWASCAIMAGVGYLALSRVEHGIIIAWLLMGLGALAKLIVHSRLDKLHRTESEPS